MSPSFPGEESDQLLADEPEVLEGELLLPEDGEADDKDDGSEVYARQAAAAHAGNSDEDDQGPQGEVIEVLNSTLPVVSRSSGLAARIPFRPTCRNLSYALLTPEEEHDLAVRQKQAIRRLPTTSSQPTFAWWQRSRSSTAASTRRPRSYPGGKHRSDEGGAEVRSLPRGPPRPRRYWIQAYVMYFLLANHRIVKVGTTQAKRKLFYNLTRDKRPRGGLRSTAAHR